MNLYQYNQIRGLLTEGLVHLLLSQDHIIEQASEEDNISRDIDLYADGVSVSIKTQHKALETGNFSFELEQKLGRQHREQPAGTWVKHQGYHRSQAELYAIVVGAKLYILNSFALHKYVRKHGWDRVVELSEGVKESQEGKLYVNARNGLISIYQACKVAEYDNMRTFDPVYLDVIQDCVQQSHGHIDLKCLRNSHKTGLALDFLAVCYRSCTAPVARKSMSYNVMTTLQTSTL